MERPERLMRWLVTLAFLAASSAVWWPADAQASVRVKELAAVQGVRSNALLGYGLVVGLDGTGDQATQTPFTTQSLNALLQQMGVTLPPGVSLQPRNVAAVLVTTQLPPFAQPGQTLDEGRRRAGVRHRPGQPHRRRRRRGGWRLEGADQPPVGRPCARGGHRRA
jgi:flagellar P-ring protein FlgI